MPGSGSRPARPPGSGISTASALAARTRLPHSPGSKDFALIGSFFGAVAAWLGVGLDGLIAKEEELWPQTPSRVWNVTPLLTSDRRGVAVSLSF